MALAMASSCSSLVRPPATVAELLRGRPLAGTLQCGLLQCARKNVGVPQSCSRVTVTRASGDVAADVSVEPAETSNADATDAAGTEAAASASNPIAALTLQRLQFRKERKKLELRRKRLKRKRRMRKIGRWPPSKLGKNCPQVSSKKKKKTTTSKPAPPPAAAASS